MKATILVSILLLMAGLLLVGFADKWTLVRSETVRITMNGEKVPYIILVSRHRWDPNISGVGLEPAGGVVGFTFIGLSKKNSEWTAIKECFRNKAGSRCSRAFRINGRWIFEDDGPGSPPLRWTLHDDIRLLEEGLRSSMPFS